MLFIVDNFFLRAMTKKEIRIREGFKRKSQVYDSE